MFGRLAFFIFEPQEATITTKAKKPTKKIPASHTAHTLLDIVMKSLDQDKGEDIKSIDLAGKSSIADYMVIATGTSSRHVASMAEKLSERLSKEGVKSRIEGKEAGDWVVLDGGDVIIHLFRAEVRSFYNLEKLWASDFNTSDYTVYKSV